MRVRSDFRTDAAPDFRFKFFDLLFGGQDFFFPSFQFGRDITLAGNEGLFANGFWNIRKPNERAQVSRL